jgi:hypothetical protein
VLNGLGARCTPKGALLHLSLPVYLISKSRWHVRLRLKCRPQSFANLLNDGTAVLLIYVDVCAHNGTLCLRGRQPMGWKRRPSPLAIVRALVFEQRVRRPLAIRDMRRFVNGGRRPRHTNLRQEFSFPVPLTDVQNFLHALEFLLRWGKHRPTFARRTRVRAIMELPRDAHVELLRQILPANLDRYASLSACACSSPAVEART